MKLESLQDIHFFENVAFVFGKEFVQSNDKKNVDGRQP